MNLSARLANSDAAVAGVWLPSEMQARIFSETGDLSSCKALTPTTAARARRIGCARWTRRSSCEPSCGRRRGWVRTSSSSTSCVNAGALSLDRAQLAAAARISSMGSRSRACKRGRASRLEGSPRSSAMAALRAVERVGSRLTRVFNPSDCPVRKCRHSGIWKSEDVAVSGQFHQFGHERGLGGWNAGIRCRLVVRGGDFKRLRETRRKADPARSFRAVQGVAEKPHYRRVHGLAGGK